MSEQLSLLISPPSTSSVADSPAKTSLRLAKEQASKAPALGSGTSTSASSKRTDRASSLSKTSRAAKRAGSLSSELISKLSVTRRWPWRSEPETLAHPTDASGSSSSGDWSSPKARDFRNPSPGALRRKSPDLPAQMWPTATAGAPRSRPTGTPQSRDLREHVQDEYPTPSASVYGSSNNGNPHDSRTAYATAGKPSLALSFPNLNPAWVAALMGFPPWLAGTRWPAARGQPQHEWEPPRTCANAQQRAEKLKALGNAVVPQCAEAVGRWIIAEGWA